MSESEPELGNFFGDICPEATEIDDGAATLGCWLMPDHDGDHYDEPNKLWWREPVT